MARGRRRKARVKTTASAVQSLVERMANVAVAPKRRKRRRRGRGAQSTVVNIPGAEGGNPNLMAFGGGRSRRRKANGPAFDIGNGGRVTLSRCELYSQATVLKNTSSLLAEVPIFPPAAQTANVFPFLQNLARVYTRLRWEKMVFEWRPAVGTTTNGIITYGVRLMDDATAPPTSRIQISALSPVNDHPVWQSSDMVVPTELLQSRKWYAIQRTGTGATNPDLVDLAPGSLQFGLSVDNSADDRMFGEFWICYRVTLDGCRAGNA